MPPKTPNPCIQTGRNKLTNGVSLSSLLSSLIAGFLAFLFALLEPSSSSLVTPFKPTMFSNLVIVASASWPIFLSSELRPFRGRMGPFPFVEAEVAEDVPAQRVTKC